MPGTPFRFALSPVLQLRDRSVDVARDALGRAVRQRWAGEEALADAEAAVASRLAMDTAGASTARQLGGAAAHRESLARMFDTTRKEVVRLREAEQRAQRALATAMREREAIETLRSEAAEAHRTVAHRAEVATLDDLAIAGRSARPLAKAA